MDPRDIIEGHRDPWEGEDPLLVLIDAASMNEQLSYGNDAARRVLRYVGNERFQYVRTSETPRYEELDQIPPYTFEEADDGRRIIRYEVDELGQTSSVTHLFGYDDESIQKIAARVYSDDIDDSAPNVEDVTAQELATVKKVFLHASLNSSDEDDLFVTNAEILLEHRRWFEDHFPGGQLNIMSAEEAVEYLGLHLRFRDQFYAGPNLTVGKLGWYWHLFRSLVPYYHVEADADDNYMRGFSTRFQNLLIAVDEIGYQYFQDPNNRTKLNVQYHFDYAISLITGVFDTLALKTAEKYGISGVRKEFISLSNNRGRDFLVEVRDENGDLRDHIADHMEFINLIHVFRPLVVHRGGYQDSVLEDADEGWTAGVIPLDRFDEEDREEFERYYREIEDDPLPYDPLTVWGMYQPAWADPNFLEPYHFIKAAVRMLVPFANEYLQLLGYEDFIEQRRDNGKGTAFIDTCERIRLDGLTYLYPEFP